MLMSTYEARLAALRDAMKKQGLDAFVVPICDEHMSEYVGSYAQRLEWLTGFGGSAGSAVIMHEKAAIFTDGRYTIQVREQVDGRAYEYVNASAGAITGWLKDNAAKGMTIGYDAWLHTRAFAQDLEKTAAKIGASAIAVESNPIDGIWSDQPPRSPAPLAVHDLEFAGKSSEEKRADIAQWLKEQGQDGVIVSALDSVAWLLNVRGADVRHTPVALSYALVRDDGSTDFFVAPEKLTDAVRAHLGNGVAVRDYADFPAALGELSGKKIVADPERAVAAIFQHLDDAGAHIA